MQDVRYKKCNFPTCGQSKFFKERLDAAGIEYKEVKAEDDFIEFSIDILSESKKGEGIEKYIDNAITESIFHDPVQEINCVVKNGFAKNIMPIYLKYCSEIETKREIKGYVSINGKINESDLYYMEKDIELMYNSLLQAQTGKTSRLMH